MANQTTRGGLVLDQSRRAADFERTALVIMFYSCLTCCRRPTSDTLFLRSMEA